MAPHPVPYLVSAGWLLCRLQALTQVDDTNFGSSLGGKPVTLHKIHDHHMVFQLCTKRFYLKSAISGCSRVAGSAPLPGRGARRPGMQHDTRNLVTSVSRPGRHNFLCFIQVLSAAGGPWEAPAGAALFPLQGCPLPRSRGDGDRGGRRNLAGEVYMPQKPPQAAI